MKNKIRGFEMAYEDTGGSGAALLLVHGFPLDRTLWAPQVIGLRDMARVIAPDLRGLGESGLPSGDVTVDAYADDLAALLDSLGVKSAIVAGLSMGGYIAFAFYRKFPARVRGLILANTKAGADSPEGKKGRDDNAVLAREKGAGAIAERMLPKMLTPKSLAERADLKKSVNDMMARQPVPGVVGALMAMRDRPDSTPTLGTITVPALVITGAEDTLLPSKESELIRDGIRGAKLVILEGAAHLSNVEQPDAFNRAVKELLKTVS